MSIINQIYQLEPTITINNECVRSEINYKGKIFPGFAYCHPDDIDFQSNLVGSSIATSRAIIEILKYELSFARLEANCLERTLKEVYHNSGLTEHDYEVFSKKVKKANKKVKIYREALKKEKKALNGYLKDLNTTFNQLRKNKTKGETSSVEE